MRDLLGVHITAGLAAELHARQPCKCTLIAQLVLEIHGSCAHANECVPEAHLVCMMKRLMASRQSVSASL